MDRRKFIHLTTGAVAAQLASPAIAAAVDPKEQAGTIRAVAFDAFTIFDPRSVAARAEELFPGKGAELMEAWRSRQFEYTWLRTMAGQYADFWTVTEEALRFGVRKVGLEADSAKIASVMGAYLELKAWPEAAEILGKFQEAGLKLALLSNFSDKMLQAGVKNSGLSAVFDHALSTDRARAFKPDPRAYSLGTDAFGLRREQIVFAAAAGWDAAGAKWFGYPTVWLNRGNAPVEELGPKPDVSGKTLMDLAAFVLRA